MEAERVATSFQADTACREFVRMELAQWIENKDDIAAKRPEYSEYGRILSKVCEAALEHAKAHNIPIKTAYGENDLYVLMASGASVLNTLRYSINYHGKQPGEHARLTFWTHHDDPLSEVRAKKVMQFSQPDIEGAVGDYLKLPYRVQELDRALADILVAMELYQFSNEMINDPSAEYGAPRSPLSWPKPIKTYLQYRLFATTTAATLAIAAMFLNRVHAINDGGMWGTVVVATALWIYDTITATVPLPKVLKIYHGQRGKVISITSQMMRSYRDLASDGPISARHVLDGLKQGADLGIVWPAPIYALLEDILARSGRF